MKSGACRIMLAALALLLAITCCLAKSIETPEQESYQRNQLDMGSDDVPLETALIRYLLTKEWLNRQKIGLEVEDRQRKRNYWKQCAFNAVSCFGRK